MVGLLLLLVGEVCVGMGVFGLYEAAFGPMETPEDFQDAFEGESCYLFEEETERERGRRRTSQKTEREIMAQCQFLISVAAFSFHS